MNSTLLTLIIGGAISFVSAMGAIVLQHILSLRRMRYESKLHPSCVLYDKQIEFLDALPPVLDELNGYITTLDVLLGEKGEKVRAELQKAQANTTGITHLDGLIDQYHMYLPSELLLRVKKLSEECWWLEIHPDTEKTYNCINLLFETQNAIRRFVGVDKLSQDLMRAVGTKPSEMSRP